ncbi:MAG: hypothetical protein ABIL58_26795 [Pseudomonadota bacterium]
MQRITKYFKSVEPCAGIRIFEDLSFAGLDVGAVLDQVVALPLRVVDGDGAPCTVIGFLAGE